MIGVSARPVKSVATTAAPPARKPVYLDGVERMRVRAGDAALAIVRRGWETVRLPIARISRVIASRSVDWDSEALILCLRHAVPIIFLDTDGQALGACQSCAPKRTAFAELIEEAVDDSRWNQLRDNWLRRRRASVLSAWRTAAQSRGNPVAVGDWLAYHRDYVYRNELPGAISREIDGWLYALVTESLQKHGIPARYGDTTSTPYNLARDLTALLRAELHFHGGRMLAAADGPRALARLFEGWARCHDALVVEHLADLKKTLRPN